MKPDCRRCVRLIYQTWPRLRHKPSRAFCNWRMIDTVRGFTNKNNQKIFLCALEEWNGFLKFGASQLLANHILTSAWYRVWISRYPGGCVPFHTRQDEAKSLEKLLLIEVWTVETRGGCMGCTNTRWWMFGEIPIFFRFPQLQKLLLS